MTEGKKKLISDNVGRQSSQKNQKAEKAAGGRALLCGEVDPALRVGGGGLSQSKERWCENAEMQREQFIEKEKESKKAAYYFLQIQEIVSEQVTKVLSLYANGSPINYPEKTD